MKTRFQVYNPTFTSSFNSFSSALVEPAGVSVQLQYMMLCKADFGLLTKKHQSSPNTQQTP
jgi:hypothetical protein